MPVELREPRSLHCASFHSVKGGVGKSTLSYLVARELAKDRPVALVDGDLTGTSLADVLPLCPPKWMGIGPDDPLPLNREPDDWHKHGDRLGELTARAFLEDSHCRRVPLLNDFLLWAKERYDINHDVHPKALLWKLCEGDELRENLFVIPSSALPNDLRQILPLIYDELHAAYIESRFEWLLHWLLEKTAVRTVVFDTPPTIPGISRSVLSMAIRLPDYIDMAGDGGTPLALTREYTNPIHWTAFLVATPDTQDLRAAQRWLERRDPQEIERIAIVINRADKAWNDLQQELARNLSELPMPEEPGALLSELPRILQKPAVVENTMALQIFRNQAIPIDISSAIEPIRTLITGS